MYRSMENVFTSAWQLARKGAKRFGGKPKTFFACALRLVIADRAKAALRLSRPVVAYSKLVVTGLRSIASVVIAFRASTSNQGSTACNVISLSSLHATQLAAPIALPQRSTTTMHSLKASLAQSIACVGSVVQRLIASFGYTMTK